MKKIMHFIAALIVAVAIVVTVIFINKVCEYTPLWLDYVIYSFSLTMAIYLTTGGDKHDKV